MTGSREPSISITCSRCNFEIKRALSALLLPQHIECPCGNILSVDTERLRHGAESLVKLRLAIDQERREQSDSNSH